MTNKTRFILAASVTAILAIGTILVVLQVFESSWNGVKSSILPQFVPIEKREEGPFIYVPFSPKVDIRFVIDGEEKYTFITTDNLQEWNATEETVYQTAMKNLDRLAKNTKMEVATASEDNDADTYIIVEPNDSYAAVRLLSSEVRKAVGNELGNSYIAAIPTRDFLIFWNTEFSYARQFAAEVEASYADEEAYPLTPDLFVVTKEGIQPVEMVEK